MTTAGGGIRGILLAAGRSTRFGSDKLVHRLPDGTPIAVAAARALRAAVPSTIAVVRPGADALARMLVEEGIDLVVTPEAREGIGCSLAAAVAATAGADGWVVALADMPYVMPVTVAKVAAAIAGGAAIAAPLYQGRRGHPVGFSSDYRDALAALSGDRGARDIVDAAAGRLVTIDCDDPGVVTDVDVPGDLG